VGSLHTGEIRVLQDGAGALGQVSQDGIEEVSAGYPAALRQGGREARGSRPPALDGLGEHADGGEIVGRLRDEIEHGFLDAEPWWTEIPERLGIQSAHVVDPYAVGCADTSGSVDRDMDEAVKPAAAGAIHRPGGRLVTKGSRPRGEDCGPGTLKPRRLAGVIDVDAVVDRSPAPAPDQASDVVRLKTSLERLTTRDDPGLPVEQSAYLVIHPTSLNGTGGPSLVERSNLWKAQPSLRGSLDG